MTQFKTVYFRFLYQYRVDDLLTVEGIEAAKFSIDPYHQDFTGRNWLDFYHIELINSFLKAQNQGVRFGS